MSESTQKASEETTANQPTPATITVTEDPNAGTVLILSIVGILVPPLAFVAWYMGAKAKRQIAEGAPYYWGGQLRTGYLVGKIYSIVIMVSAVAATVGVIVFLMTARSIFG